MKKTRKQKQIRVKLVGSDAHTAYISLPGHTHEPGICYKTVRLEDLVSGYIGPMVNLDFRKDGRLIGFEVVVFGSDEQ